MQNIYFWLILFFILLGYFLERFLEYLNTRAWSEEVPPPLRGIYDEKEYARSQRYYLDNLRFGVMTSAFSTILTLAMILTGGFAFLDQWTGTISWNEILHTLLFFGVLGLGYDLLTMPFQWYDNFVIEARYGFNRMTKRTFLTDKMKSWFLAVVIGGPLLAALVMFYQMAGKTFWLWAWMLFTLFSLFFTMFYSSLIVPLFNEQKPLEEGRLRERILKMCKEAGFPHTEVYVMDGSRRSSKANAYFTGIGKKKRIVLYDTLLQDLSEEEVLAVLAHEIGHYRKKHVFWSLLLSVLETGLLLWVLSLFLRDPRLSEALGGEGTSLRLGLVAFTLIISPLTTLLGLVTGLISRRNEFAADAFAAALGYKTSLSSALIRLSMKNLSNLTPHPAYVFFHFSHPPLLDRLSALDKNAHG